MNNTPNKRLIGAFVTIAFILLFGTFLLIKRDVLSTRTTSFVMFFEGSVKGLSVGAPVVFNGVPIGRVSNIALTANIQDLSFQIPVTVEIYSDNFSEKRKHKSFWDMDFYQKNDQKVIFHQLIQKGLRARLIMQSILTGQMMIELSFYPDTKIILRGSGRIPEIPTLPSSFVEMSRIFQNLPIHQIATNLNTFLQQLNTLLLSVNNETPTLFANINSISKNVNMLISPDSQTVLDLNRLLKDSAFAAQSLRNWADYLERHPEALLKGKGGR